MKNSNYLVMGQKGTPPYPLTPVIRNRNSRNSAQRSFLLSG